MELFEKRVDKNHNLLPYDGIVNYHGKVFQHKEANEYFEVLMKSIAWERDVAVIFGKRIETKRKVAWYGDMPFEYTYSNNTKTALPWTDELVELKNTVEMETQATFNSCLLNLYHDGSEGMAWHRDEEDDLKKDGAIASITLGAERKFAFKHRTSKETISLMLEHGSLLIMKGTTQTHWLHRLPPSKKVSTARINLTFRTILD